MAGDRHSDIAGGKACGLFAVGVTWGYGSRAELVTAGADALIDRPGALLEPSAAIPHEQSRRLSVVRLTVVEP